jgi:hypothetical protein
MVFLITPHFKNELLYFSTIRQSSGRDVGGGPCGLEVETAGNTIDVNALADEI